MDVILGSACEFKAEKIMLSLSMLTTKHLGHWSKAYGEFTERVSTS